jgi:hypothetical protein
MLYIEYPKFFVSRHRAVVPENTISLCLCIFLSYALFFPFLFGFYYQFNLIRGVSSDIKWFQPPPDRSCVYALFSSIVRCSSNIYFGEYECTELWGGWEWSLCIVTTFTKYFIWLSILTTTVIFFFNFKIST